MAERAINLQSAEIFEEFLVRLRLKLEQLGIDPLPPVAIERIKVAVQPLSLNAQARVLGTLLDFPPQAILCCYVYSDMQQHLSTESQQLAEAARQRTGGVRKKALNMLRDVAVPLRRHSLTYEMLGHLMAPFVELSLAPV
jgi:hypothetical protein